MKNIVERVLLLNKLFRIETIFKSIIIFLLLISCTQYSYAANFKNIKIKPKNNLHSPVNLRNQNNHNPCPKLEIRSLRIKKVDYYNHNYFIFLSGFVKNSGGQDFPSTTRMNKVIFSAKGIVTASSRFGAIAKGHSVPFEGLVKGNMGAEFTPDIHVKISLGKIKLSGTCNSTLTGYKIYSQPEVVISRAEINRAIANYHRSHPRPAKADLIITNAGWALVDIKNQGGKDAPANKLIMTCKKVGFRGHKGFGCPKPIEKLPYDSRSQGYIFNVPAIAAGHSYRLRFPIRGNVKWKKGRYNFTFLVDGKKQVTESNERNNSKTSYVVGGG